MSRQAWKGTVDEELSPSNYATVFAQSARGSRVTVLLDMTEMMKIYRLVKRHLEVEGVEA